MSHTNKDDSIEILKDTKNTNDDGKYKDDISKNQDSNESVDNPENSDTSRNESFINKTKEEAALIERLITMNFKHHVMKYVIDIVTTCGGKKIKLKKKSTSKI